MIVCEYFEGDDIDFAWKQHDVYAEAIDIILQNCAHQIRNACVVTGIDPFEFASFGSLDHRTIQHTHDLLAAVFRFGVEPPNEQLDLFKTKNYVKSTGEWLKWLTFETRNWHNQPKILFYFRELSKFQNEERGLVAEAGIAKEIKEYFRVVPWK